MRMNSSEEAISAVEQWLAASKNATLHWFKDNRTVEDGYIEVSITEEEGYIKAFTGVEYSTLKEHGWFAAGLKEVIEGVIACSNKVTADKILTLIEHGVIRTDEIYVRILERKWLFVSEHRVCMIRHDTDWNSVSEFYGENLNPIRH